MQRKANSCVQFIRYSNNKHVHLVISDSFLDEHRLKLKLFLSALFETAYLQFFTNTFEKSFDFNFAMTEGYQI